MVAVVANGPSEKAGGYADADGLDIAPIVRAFARLESGRMAPVVCRTSFDAQKRSGDESETAGSVVMSGGGARGAYRPRALLRPRRAPGALGTARVRHRHRHERRRDSMRCYPPHPALQDEPDRAGASSRSALALPRDRGAARPDPISCRVPFVFSVRPRTARQRAPSSRSSRGLFDTSGLESLSSAVFRGRASAEHRRRQALSPWPSRRPRSRRGARWCSSTTRARRSIRGRRCG